MQPVCVVAERMCAIQIWKTTQSQTVHSLFIKKIFLNLFLIPTTCRGCTLQFSTNPQWPYTVVCISHFLPTVAFVSLKHQEFGWCEPSAAVMGARRRPLGARCGWHRSGPDREADVAMGLPSGAGLILMVALPCRLYNYKRKRERGKKSVQQFPQMCAEALLLWDVSISKVLVDEYEF